MEALEDYGSSEGSDEEDGTCTCQQPTARGAADAAAPPPRKRVKHAPPRNRLEHALRLRESLQLLQSDRRWPCASKAAERKQALQWFVGVCSHEFAADLAAHPEVARGEHAGLHVFGSEECDMWVPDSDIDCNMWTLERIPRFFVRLKQAVMAADGAAHVDIAAGARVPVARVRARGQRFDVTHEHGEHNPVVFHHKQVQQWVRQSCRIEPAIAVAMRVIKLWAAANKLNNPTRGTLNSLGFLVLLLALPSVQREWQQARQQWTEGAVEVAGSCVFTASPAQTQRAVELLQEFFAQYSRLGAGDGRGAGVVFAAGGNVGSEGWELDKKRLDASVSDTQHTGAGTSLYIQDPFLRDINLGRFVTRLSLRRLRAAFSAAHHLLNPSFAEEELTTAEQGRLENRRQGTSGGGAAGQHEEDGGQHGNTGPAEEKEDATECDSRGAAAAGSGSIGAGCMRGACLGAPVHVLVSATDRGERSIAGNRSEAVAESACWPFQALVVGV